MTRARWARGAARTAKVVLATCCVAAAAPIAAESILQFDQWMQKIDRRSQSMQRDLAAHAPAAALSDAREIGELYRLMQDYFVRRGDNSEDAVKLSRDGAALADAVAGLVQENDFDGALRSAGALTRACRDCHVRYKPLEP